MVKKIGFVRPTKTAGSELRMLFDSHLDMVPCLWKPDDGGAPTHASLEEVYNPDTIWIGSVRHPYTRLYSIYNFFGGKLFQGGDQSDWRDLDFIEFCTQLKHYKMNSVFDDNFPLKSCFETLSLNGKVGVDHIIRFEHLDEDLKKLSTALGLETTLVMPPPRVCYEYAVKDNDGNPLPPRKKIVYKNTNRLLTYDPTNAPWTPETINIINEVYEQDFANFGYHMV